MAGNFAKRVGDTLETMFGTRKSEITTQTGTYKQTGDQSNLEKIGFQMRKDHLLRNEWGKDMEYTKQLVSSEYLIQNEFLVGDDMETVKAEQEAARKKEEDATKRKIEKLKKKRENLDDRITNLEDKLPVEKIKP
jgi:hypothetical protein